MKANNYLVVPLNQSISAKMHIAISLYKTHLSLAVYAITYYLLINSLTLINCLQIILAYNHNTWQSHGNGI